MNPANLQLEGIYTVLAALITALERKQILSSAEILDALDEAERSIEADTRRAGDLSHANQEAVRFPVRYMRAIAEANGPSGLKAGGDGRMPTFGEVATAIGRRKDV
ncbi:hypothetical protein [Mongoliimonas terrestris]|uniref:hypothetical protein n=1 Tax=Mongoliimonas terrestris TaxID=1709001 RepID=UPI0009497BC4|nr:hypothetical protein [Mongoliimonas terrestris]